MDASPHILVVDDDRDIRDLLGRLLRQHGFRVSAAANGQDMQRVLDGHGIELIILDLMLPGEDGLSLCRKLRATSDLPVIMLTAIGEDVDRIVGLEMGADDYLAKPFNPRELIARIKAVLRRSGGVRTRLSGAREEGRGILGFAGWRFDLDRRELRSPEGLLVPLSDGEYTLLVAFVRHPHRVLSRDQLIDLARGREAEPFDRAIDVQVSRLRRKLDDDPKEPQLIKTVRGGGYIFAPKVDAL